MPAKQALHRTALQCTHSSSMRSMLVEAYSLQRHTTPQHSTAGAGGWETLHCVCICAAGWHAVRQCSPCLHAQGPKIAEEVVAS